MQLNDNIFLYKFVSISYTTDLTFGQIIFTVGGKLTAVLVKEKHGGNRDGEK